MISIAPHFCIVAKPFKCVFYMNYVIAFLRMLPLRLTILKIKFLPKANNPTYLLPQSHLKLIFCYFLLPSLPSFCFPMHWKYNYTDFLPCLTMWHFLFQFFPLPSNFNSSFSPYLVFFIPSGNSSLTHQCSWLAYPYISNIVCWIHLFHFFQRLLTPGEQWCFYF